MRAYDYVARSGVIHIPERIRNEFAALDNFIIYPSGLKYLFYIVSIKEFEKRVERIQEKEENYELKEGTAADLASSAGYATIDKIGNVIIDEHSTLKIPYPEGMKIVVHKLDNRDVLIVTKKEDPKRKSVKRKR